MASKGLRGCVLIHRDKSLRRDAMFRIPLRPLLAIPLVRRWVLLIISHLSIFFVSGKLSVYRCRVSSVRWSGTGLKALAANFGCVFACGVCRMCLKAEGTVCEGLFTCSLLCQILSLLCQVISLLCQISSLLCQLCSLVCQLCSLVCQIVSLLCRVCSLL